MQDIQTAIVLLTVLVTVLSIVMILMIVLIIILLVKLRKIADNIQTISANMASATEWLSPAKVMGQLVKLFKK